MTLMWRDRLAQAALHGASAFAFWLLPGLEEEFAEDATAEEGNLTVIAARAIEYVREMEGGGVDATFLYRRLLEGVTQAGYLDVESVG